MHKLWAFVGLTLASFGCSGSDSPSAVEVAIASAQTRCTKLATCSPSELSIRYGDVATCEAQEQQNLVNALAAPGNGNTPDRAQACTTAIQAQSCPDFLGPTVPTACVQVTGALANGASCAFPGQCQTGYCAVPTGSTCGTCASVPAPGDSCASVASCPQGMVCTSDTQTCEPQGVANASCGKGLPCAAGLSCVGANAQQGITGTCQPSLESIGATCDPTQKTTPGCDRSQGLVCNSTSKQCAQIVIAPGGQPCGSVNGQNTPCAAGGKCSTSTPGQQGTCIAAAADGAACDTAAGPGCEPLARCIVTASGGTAGTCQQNDASACH